jgi:copper chaperone CopZ
MTTRDFESCPSCEQKGRKVDAVTLRSLLVDEAKGRLSDSPTRFCRTPDCDVVYFDEKHEQSFVTADVRVEVFQKSRSPERLVCYCFDHSVGSIQDEVRATGGSVVPDAIGAKCKAGLDECEINNPQGSCCLGNVRKVIKEAIARSGGVVSEEDEPAPACCGGGTCSVEPQPELEVAAARSASDSAGLLSSGGAVVAAILASACCWLPLALIGLGASTVGVAGFFEAYRFYFLAATGVLLGAGFYFVYIRKPKCAPGSACAVPNPRLKRFNKITLWVAAAMVVLFASFPNYIGALLGGDDTGAAVAQAPSDVERTYAIQGMTCAGCVTHLNSVLRELPGVKSAEVSLEHDNAVVVFEAGQENDDAIVQAVASAGYAARPPGE